MKKLLFIFLSFFIFFSLPWQGVEAQKTDAEESVATPATIEVSPQFIYPPSYTSGVYLSAIFNKKGSSQMAAKLVFDESDKELLTNFSFFIPGKNIDLVRVLHEKSVLKQQCNGKYPVPVPLMKPEGTSSSETITVSSPCYKNYVSVFTTLEPTIEKTKDGLKVSVSANPDLENKTQESLLLLYRTSSYTRKFLTNFYYHLSTPRLPITVATAQIGITVKDGLILRGASLYPNGVYYPSLRSLEKARDLKEEENQELANVANEIIYQGMLRKSESDLTFETSFTTKGIYGTFWPLLYLNEVVILFTVLILGTIIIFFLLKIILKKNPYLKLMFISASITFIITTLLIILILAIVFWSRFWGFVPN